MGNIFLYPVPRSSYHISTEDPTLIFVPQDIQKSVCGSFLCPKNRRETTMIPCRFLPCQTYTSPYLLLFFHGNSEDIGSTLSELLLQFGERFSMNVLCPEYPSYGIYKKKDDSLTMDEAMLHDARTVLQYCHKRLKYEYDNIILVGRSLGSAVVVRLASEFHVRGAVLISPFTSIKDVAKHIVGRILAKMVDDVFRSIDFIDQSKCPVLFIHGEDDELIPPDMVIELHAKMTTSKMLRINQFMTHNQFRLESDVFTPMHMFMISHLDLRPHLLPRVKRFLQVYGPKVEPNLVEQREVEDEVETKSNTDSR